MLLHDAIGLMKFYRRNIVLLLSMAVALFRLCGTASAGHYDVRYCGDAGSGTCGGWVGIVGPLGTSWGYPFFTFFGAHFGGGTSSEPPPYPGGQTSAGPGSVTVSGTIKAICTWSPDYDGEEPPSVVIVRQTCNASWTGDVGSCDNGLGFSEIVDPEGFSGSSSGVKYSVQQDPKEEFEVPCSPSAYAFVGTTPGGPSMAATATVGYRVEVGQVGIALSGGIQDESGRSYLIGQKCTAEVWCEFVPPLTISGHEWSVKGGDPFKQFYVNHVGGALTSEGRRINLAPSDYSVSTFGCYFSQPGEIEVHCSVSIAVPVGDKPIGGIVAEVSSKAITELPTFRQVNLNPGYVRLDGDFLHLDSNPPPTNPAQPNHGFLWRFAVNTPAKYVFNDYGLWRWVQLVTLKRTRVVNGVTQTLKCGTESLGWHTKGLDSTYPYEPLEPDPPQAWYANNSEHNAEDSPGNDLESVASSYNVGDDFETFLMYMPPGAGSEWVPLRKIVWKWAGQATRSGSQWVFSNPSHTIEVPNKVPEHPKWDHLIRLTRIGNEETLVWR